MLKDLLDITLSESEYYDTAIIDLYDGESRFFTYKDLEDTAKKVASWLVSSGYKKGSKIPIISKNSFEYVAVFFGIRLASMVPVLLSYKLPSTTLKKIIEENLSEIVFCDRDTEEKIQNKKIFFLENIHFLNPKELTTEFQVSQKDLAFILYTSGSSGHPKGVLITNEARLWTINHLKSKDFFKRRFVSANPLFHMNGLTAIEVNLGSHELTVLLPYFEVETFLSMSNKHRAFSWIVVTPMMSMILSREDLLKIFPRQKIILISLGSSPVTEKLYKNIKNQFSNAIVVIRYGLTEVGASIFREHPEKIPTPEMSVGYTRPEIEYKIVDEVLWLKSPGMFSSYSNQKHDLDSEGFFNTKDRFTKDDRGFYYFIGRADDMFVCGGENIYPSEIESIINSHPDVEQTIVVGIKDEIKGSKPVAFIKLKDSSKISEVEIKNYFLDYSTLNKCPRAFVFVDSFPLTGVGKIDKERLIKGIQ